MTAADRQRRYRARLAEQAGRAPGVVGRPVSQPCGTVSAYKRHLRRGEPTCTACRRAWADWVKIRSKKSQKPS